MSATVGSASIYPLRNSSDIQTLHINSRLYYSSDLPSAVGDWSEVPEKNQNSPSFNILKKQNPTSLHHPDTITQVKDLVKYFMLN